MDDQANGLLQIYGRQLDQGDEVRHLCFLCSTTVPTTTRVISVGMWSMSLGIADRVLFITSGGRLAEYQLWATLIALDRLSLAGSHT